MEPSITIQIGEGLSATSSLSNRWWDVRRYGEAPLLATVPFPGQREKTKNRKQRPRSPRRGPRTSQQVIQLGTLPSLTSPLCTFVVETI